MQWIAFYSVNSAVQPLNNKRQGPVSLKSPKILGPVKPFLVQLYLKMEKRIVLQDRVNVIPGLNVTVFSSNVWCSLILIYISY